jgi:DNA-binding NarL/FixJ family response regulator
LADAIHLTHREREVLALVTEGYQNKEIGQRLHIVASTVKFHVRALFRKYSVDSRIKLVRAACERKEAAP